MNTKDKINRFSKVFMIISLLCVGFLRLDIEGSVSASTDYSSEVVIDDFDIIDSSGNPLSDTNAAKYYSTYQYNVSWTLIPMGDVIRAGDTLVIPILKNSQTGYWSVGNSAYVDFKDASGVVIGQWKINNNQIEVIFSEDAEGLGSVSATFKTGSNALRSLTMRPIDVIQDVSVGNVTKSIKFLARELGVMGGGDAKTSSSTSNSQINWHVYTNRTGAVELTTKEWGTSFTERNNVYVEDVIEEGANICQAYFGTTLYTPIDLVEGVPSADVGLSISLSSYFTKVDQNAGESYTDFKARLGVFEYGIYTNGSGQETFVVNYGDIGNNGLKHSDITKTFAQDAATRSINSGFYDESDRSELEAYFEKTYGDSNVINGDVSWYSVGLTVEYDKVLKDTPKTNVAQLTVEGVTKDLTRTATLQGNLGTTSVSSSAAGLYLYDEETGVLLEGGTFKVQYNNNGIWEDYSSAGILTTDEEGFLQTPTLGAGTYRFIQLSASDEVYNLVASQGYDSSLGNVISAEFTINPLESEGEIVEVSNIKHRYDVVYTSGEYGTFEDDEHLEVVALSNTPGYDGELCDKGNPIGEEGYDFVGWDKEVSPVVTSSAVYIAQWEVATVEEPGEELGPENNPEQVGTSTPDGGLETSPLGMLVVLIVGGFSLIFRIKK